MSEEQKKRGRPRKVTNAIEGADVLTSGPMAEAFAKKVWASQSPDEPRHWRIARVKEAMANRGFSMDGIVL